MEEPRFNFGVVDNRFLARSLGLLNPPPAITILDESSIEEAIKLFQQHRIGALAVTDIKGKLTGIFTERDVVLKVCLSDIKIAAAPISELMTCNPQTAQMTTTMSFALNMMTQGGYRNIPIVDETGFPLAMVSVKDVVDYLVHALTKDLGGV